MTSLECFTHVDRLRRFVPVAHTTPQTQVNDLEARATLQYLSLTQLVRLKERTGNGLKTDFSGIHFLRHTYIKESKPQKSAVLLYSKVNVLECPLS